MLQIQLQFKLQPLAQKAPAQALATKAQAQTPAKQQPPANNPFWPSPSATPTRKSASAPDSASASASASAPAPAQATNEKGTTDNYSIKKQVIDSSISSAKKDKTLIE